MQYYPFDSRNILYRSAIGAAAAGETLRLRLLLHHDAHCHEVFLRFRRDSEDAVTELPMDPAGTLEDYRFYERELTLAEGLYWYSFRYTSDYGEFFVIKTADSLGIVSQTPGDWWQQTVYEADFNTPDWLRGGVIYQIFPDRFCASGQEKADVPEDRFLCSDWTRQPEYRQHDCPCRLGNDYYSGDLLGITEKLPYIASLGVSCIYLNPIFEAHSNHRYNTADYLKIDPLLGTEEDLRELCRRAGEYGISVILDGVFSHTGDDSRYFNRYGRYPTLGAYQSEDSPYRSWYRFGRSRDDYAAWWGVVSLPETDEGNPDFQQFITGPDGVLRYWLKQGVRGWRLDVADELPDDFLDRVRTAVKSERPDAYLLGEVWEDASNKVSYGSRRRFLRGRQLDSVMNYPFAEAIIRFVREGDAGRLNDAVCDILEHYPPCCVHLLMNHIGTHDTARIITRLAAGGNTGDREWQSRQVLSRGEYERGVRLLRLAAAIQYTLPGVPSLYYGDEAGMQGYGDPFCRGAFPWGGADERLTEFYRRLGRARRGCAAFREGEYLPVLTEGDALVYIRQGDGAAALLAVNRSNAPLTVALPEEFLRAEALFGTKPDADGTLTVAAEDFALLCL